MNGRAARDKGKGLLTCKNSSTVDYFVCSSNLIPKVSDFCVEDFCEILSDVHCPVFLELNFEKICSETTESSSNEVKIKLWDQKKHEQFVSNLDLDALNTVNNEILHLKSSDEICQKDINNIVDNITNLIITNAEKSFGKFPLHSKSDNISKSSSWFGHNCTKARKQFHRARYQYKLRKTYANKEFLKNASTNYKRTVKMFHFKFQQNNIRNIRKLKHTNPKKVLEIFERQKERKRKS